MCDEVGEAEAVPAFESSRGPRARTLSAPLLGTRRSIAGFALRPHEALAEEGRLLDRSETFGQSEGRLRIDRKHRSRRLYCRDLFHVVADASVWKILIGLTLLYLAVIVAFAVLWWAASPACDVGIEDFNGAFLFSLETMMTIGYGTRDYFFVGCRAAPPLIFAQSLLGILLDCVSLGLVYTQVSSGVGRAATILFSDRAVVREIDGALYFMFQVVEMRRQQLLEAHVRCYCVRDEVDATGRKALFQQCAMRLDKPDDELGGYLFLALPSVVVHRLDAWSPLAPPAWWLDAYYDRAPDRGGGGDGSGAFSEYAFPRPAQRASDADAGGRAAETCCLCGESFETEGNLRLHYAESHPEAAAPRPRPRTADADAIRAYLREGRHEIVVLIEGVDATTSSTIQASHSYKVSAGDVVWHCDYAPCVARAKDGSCVVDYGKFHDLVSTGDRYRDAPPPPPSHS